MNRGTFNRIGLGTCLSGLGLLAAAAPASAADFAVGALFGTSGRGGTVAGGFVRIGDRPAPIYTPAPVVVAPPVITERVWVETPRIVCRQVPVFDACGTIIAYREVKETVMEGHWETRTRPAPVACAPAPVVHHSSVNVGFGVNVRNDHRVHAPAPGRVPTAPSHLRGPIPAGNNNNLTIGNGLILHNVLSNPSVQNAIRNAVR